MNYFEKVQRELIFPEDSCPFKMCHASNLCHMENGKLIVGWFAGEREGSDDIAVWSSKRGENGWERPVCLAHDIDEPHWNPVFYQREDGKVLLFYKVGREIQKWYTALRISEDFGNSFSEPEELVKGDRGGRGPVRCKVITLSDGSMLAGTSIEGGIWTAYADRSEDGGKIWELSEPVTIDVDYNGENTGTDSTIEVSSQSFYGRGVIQPTLWESEPGRIHMLLRSTEGRIYRADSTDYGKSFCKAYPTELPNNNSGIDVVKCDDGLLVLCMNPVEKNWGPRTPIILMVSSDNGKSWKEEIILEDISGEYSYPSIISVGNRLFVSYTYDRKSIAFWEFKRKAV